MKRILASLLILVPAFLTLSQNGAEAVAPTLFDRFASGKPEGESGVYTFDKAHSTIGFRVRHTGLIEVPGYFRDFKGSINYDANNVTKSTVEFTAKATSVDTGVAPRDNHLRTADFFEVEKYPDITFKSTKVEKKGKMWMVTGDLTMKAVTKTHQLPVSDRRIFACRRTLRSENGRVRRDDDKS